MQSAGIRNTVSFERRTQHATVFEILLFIGHLNNSIAIKCEGDISSVDHLKKIIESDFSEIINGFIFKY